MKVSEIETVEAILVAHGEGEIREIDLNPDVAMDTNDVLNAAYHYGQNDHQPRTLPSVSVGDVIVLKGAEPEGDGLAEREHYLVESIGFTEIQSGTAFALMSAASRGRLRREREEAS